MMSQLISPWNREPRLITGWWRGGWSIYRAVNGMWRLSAFDSHIWIQVVLASDLYRNISEVKLVWPVQIPMSRYWHQFTPPVASSSQVVLTCANTPLPPSFRYAFFMSGLTHTELQSKKKPNQTNQTKKPSIYFCHILLIQRLEDLLI